MDQTPTQRALSSQGLTEADVAANREGRVSPAQLALLGGVYKTGVAYSYIVFGGGAVASWVLAGFHYVLRGGAAIFIVPAAIGAFFALIYTFVYRLNRLPSPGQIASARVTTMRAVVGGSLVGFNRGRGVYNVWLDNVRYTGCSSSLSDEIAKKGMVVNAYVVAERKLVVAMVPAG